MVTPPAYFDKLIKNHSRYDQKINYSMLTNFHLINLLTIIIDFIIKSVSITNCARSLLN